MTQACAHCEDGLIWSEDRQQCAACPHCLLLRLRNPESGWSGDAAAVSDYTAYAAALEIEYLKDALEYARELLWRHGFSENDLQPVRYALSRLDPYPYGESKE